MEPAFARVLHLTLCCPRGSCLALAVVLVATCSNLKVPGVTHCPVEVRHPFFDLRVVNYLLALPPFPLFFEKRLLREAVAGRLPERIRTRRKSPLAGDPLLAHLGQRHTPWMDQVVWTDEMDLMLISRALAMFETKRIRRKWTPMFARFASTFGCSQRAEVRYNLRAEVRNA